MKPWNFSAFSLSAFKFGVQSYSTFSTFRRLVIRHSVIRCWVPVRRWVQFGVRSFGVRSFGVQPFGVQSFGVRSIDVQSFGIQ